MHIAYTRPDGGVSVIVPAPDAKLPTESDADFMARVALAVPPDATNVTQVETLPTRTFRNAWKVEGGAVAHDMVKARALKMAEIRKERDARLAASDISYMRAQEQNKAPEMASLKGQRQALRDLPDTISLDGINDVATLAAYQPVWPL